MFDPKEVDEYAEKFRQINGYWPNMVHVWQAAQSAQSEKIAQLKARIAELLGEHGQRIAQEAMIKNIGINNGLTMSLEGGACQLLAEHFASQFASSGATNYLEMTFVSKEYMSDEKLCVTLQRVKGLTPHQFRLVAEQENEKLKARIEELETPDQFWVFDNPEDSCTAFSESIVEAVFDNAGGEPSEFVGHEFRVMRSRKLPDAVYKITGFTVDQYDSVKWKWEETEVVK